MKPLYLNYWGKTQITDNGGDLYHPVAYHCLDVAAVLSVLLSTDSQINNVCSKIPFLKNSNIKPFLLFLASLHDIGKFSVSFQNLNPELLLKLQNKSCDVRYYPRHDTAGYLLISEYLFDQFLNQDSFPFFKWDGEFYRDDWWDLLLPLISATTGHHGVPPTGAEILLKRIFPPDTLPEILCFAQDCTNLFFKDNNDGFAEISFDEEFFSVIAEISFVFAGTIVLSDWIASNTMWFQYVPGTLPLDQYWIEYALPQASRALQQTGILPIQINPKTGFQEIFPNIHHMHPMQEICENCEVDSGPGLFIIEDQCGMGKTESALVLSHRLMNQGNGEGIFFALPTMATANAMFRRVGEFYTHFFSPSNNTPEIVLTHSRSQMVSDKFSFLSHEASHYSVDGESSGSTQAISWLSDSRKKALLAHVGVGTIDQALMAILAFRHQSLRLLGLMRNVLIIDEVHSYDPYVHTLLCQMIEFHSSYGGNIILLSATLPLSTKKDLIDSFRKGTKTNGILPSSIQYPLFTSCSMTNFHENSPKKPTHKEGSSKTYLQVLIVESWKEIIDLIKEAVSQDKCVAYIRNTVADAIEAYRIISEQIGVEKTLLFHARFVLSDRLMHEDAILSRFGKEGTIENRKGWVLISTQVIEQSLDVDFDLMITDLAPVDLLVQRAGRIQRHSLPEPYRIRNREPATLVIRAPPIHKITDTWYSGLFPKAAYVYPDHGRLFLSLQALMNRGLLTFPDDTREIIEEVYGADSFSQIPPELMKHTLKAMGKDNTGKTMAGLNVLQRKKGYVFSIVHWDEDVYTPTRLSELSYPLFFGRKEEGVICPLYGSGTEGWVMSQIFVPDRIISKEYSHESEFFPPEIPMKNSDRVVLIMEPDTTGWYCYAEKEKEKEKEIIKVTYNVIEGFNVEKM